MNLRNYETMPRPLSTKNRLPDPAINQLTAYQNQFPEYIPSSNYDKVETRAWSYFSVTRRIWEYIIFIISILYPVELSFVMIFDRNISVTTYSVFFIFDVVQIADNFVILYTPFLHNGILISDKKEILKNYGITFYVIHIIASLPLGWIGIIKGNPNLYLYLSINRLLRLPQCYRSYKLIMDSTLYNRSYASLIPPIVIISCIIHVFACILYSIGKYADKDESWITQFKDQNYNQIQMYVASIYFVLTTILTLGYGDIHPISTPEVIVCIFITIAGVTFQSVLIANMVNALSDPMGTKFLSQYEAMQRFLKFKGVPDLYKNHIKNYFQGSWERNHGAPSWQALLAPLPKGIQSGIKLEFCQRTFSGMPLFYLVGQKYLLLIMNSMQPFTYLPGDIICEQDEEVPDLLIFNHGIIQLILNDVPLASLNVDSGYVDGERQLMFGKPQDKTIKAVTFVDGWRLRRKDFLDLINSRKMLRTILLANARARFPKDFQESPEWDDNQIPATPPSDNSEDSVESEKLEEEFIYVEQSSSSYDSQFTDADL